MSVKKFLKAAKDIKEQAEEPKPAASHDESNWLVSYADMMTLLCGFFIMLFSMAKMDEPKYEKVKEAMSKQFGGDYKSPTNELAKFVTEVVQEAGADAQAIVKTDESGVTIQFQSLLFFDSLSADIKPEGRKVLDRLAKDLYGRQKADGKLYQVVVEGHTDSRPVVAGPFPSNWELSGARASRVVHHFLDQHFTPDHLTAIGYGDTRPEFSDRRADGTLDDAALAKNRRVVVRILSANADSIPFPKALGAPKPETAAAKVPATAAAAQKTDPPPPSQAVIDKAREAMAKAREAVAKAQAQEALAKAQAQEAVAKAQEEVAKAQAQEALIKSQAPTVTDAPARVPAAAAPAAPAVTVPAAPAAPAKK